MSHLRLTEMLEGLLKYLCRHIRYLRGHVFVENSLIKFLDTHSLLRRTRTVMAPLNMFDSSAAEGGGHWEGQQE